MADQDEEQEPSIEEILSSIRQIIADDEDEEGGETPAEDTAAAEPEAAPEPEEDEEDVVELTEEVEPESPAPEPEPEPTPEPEEAPEEDIEVAMEEPEPEPEPTPEPEPDIIMEAPEEDSLLTDIAEDAAFEGFTEIVRKTAVEHNGITIEEIVRTELRPLLKDWLDSNLPSIIERLVAEELERVSKRALGED